MPEPDEVDRKNLEGLVGTRTEQLRQSMSDFEHAQDCVLEAYGDALWLKDAATGLHSRRVAAFALALAHAMQLSAEEIRQVAKGAFLHDVGKLAIADDLLTKSTPFTAHERQAMERHCLWGYRIVSKIKFLYATAELIHAHHENWDGTGYPKGLKGEAIPLGARIIAVVNAFDSITSPQPYRAARTIDQAAQELTIGSGTQFDPRMVAVFLHVPQTTWRDISKEIGEQSKNFTPIQ